MEHELNLFFLLLLAGVAFLYASVGHGGASGYLALMALFGFSPEVMRPTALVLNIFVSGIAFFHYYRSGNFSWQLFWPFAITAVPAAFLGGLITPPADLYKQLLGAFLLIPAIRFMLPANLYGLLHRPINLYWALLTGAAIGIFSGMIGIGGGIILSPLLIIFGWADMKRAAAVSAAFIFVNSAAGLGGQLQQGVHFSADMMTMVGLALAGGIAGSYFGAFRFNRKILGICLSIVLFIAAFKLLFT